MFHIFTYVLQVLDEADRLLNDDFEKSLDEILNSIPRERRTYLFSATMTKKVQILFYNQNQFYKIRSQNLLYLFYQM